MSGSVTYKKAQVIQILRALEEIVPSLDRIGSCASSATPEDLAQMTNDFIDNWDVFAKLSQARSILSEPFDYDELEELMADVPHWRFNARLPP